MIRKISLVGLLILCGMPLIVNGQPAKHVVIISIDGFRPDFYREVKWGAVNPRQMASDGVSADGVNSIFHRSIFQTTTRLLPVSVQPVMGAAITRLSLPMVIPSGTGTKKTFLRERCGTL